MPASYVYELSGAQNNRCCYCHHDMLLVKPKANSRILPPDILTKDHYIPRCYGGPTKKENLVAACGQCNWIRGSLDAETFYELIQYWFRNDTSLHARWHVISREEFSKFKRECERVDRIRWSRRIKKCVAALAINEIVPIPVPPHQIRA